MKSARLCRGSWSLVDTQSRGDRSMSSLRATRKLQEMRVRRISYNLRLTGYGVRALYVSIGKVLTERRLTDTYIQRVDPDRLYWQRNDQAHTEGSEEEHARPATARTRPPSYASDDGVTYVVEARPRSMVPPTDVPLPPHPSEVGRLHMTERA